MAKQKKGNLFTVILLILVLLLGGYIIKTYVLTPGDDVPDTPEPPSIDVPVTPPEDVTPPAPEKKETSIVCRFEGKMDENSFEVTELINGADGDILELRAGNDSVRQSIDIAEIGETITVVYTPNDDNQLIVTKIIFN